MSDQPARPTGAIALAEELFPEAVVPTWQGLGGGGLNRLWRVTATVGGELVSAVLKATGDAGHDSGFADRETKTYVEVLPRFSIRVPDLLGSFHDGKTTCLALEDLTAEYRFPDSTHRWTPAEVSCFLPTYVRLHLEGTSVAYRSWMLSYERPTWTPDLVASHAAELTAWGVWGELPGLEGIAADALDRLPGLGGLDTVLHLDVHPPNVGLRLGNPCEAALIDWDMTGWGAPEFDLAYLDLQPFGAARGVERDQMLDWYWAERGRQTGSELSHEERRDRQRLADTVFALALIPLAHRSVVEQYPRGSQPGSYWEAMRPVLFGRLRRLLQ